MLQAVLLLLMTTAACDSDHRTVIALAPLVHITPGNENHVNYLRACAAYGLGDRAMVERCATAVLDSVVPAERRHVVIADRLLREVATWRDGDLDDIGRDMRRSADDLQHRRLPRHIQDEILRKLDKLIEEQERPLTPDPNSSQESQRPQNESIPMGGPDGKGKVTEKTFQKLGETWGTMPEAERAKVLQQVGRDVPDKYRQMVETYLKALGRQ